MAKKVLVLLPAGLLEQTDFVARAEQRNRSDLIRESLRRYIQEFNRKQQAQHTLAAEPRDLRMIVLSDSDQ
jgi:metal-responsive CopG/Arc/MetJ family transcriptional regulator